MRLCNCAGVSEDVEVSTGIHRRPLSLLYYAIGSPRVRRPQTTRQPYRKATAKPSEESERVWGFPPAPRLTHECGGCTRQEPDLVRFMTVWTLTVRQVECTRFTISIGVIVVAATQLGTQRRSTRPGPREKIRRRSHVAHPALNSSSALCARVD